MRALPVTDVCWEIINEQRLPVDKLGAHASCVPERAVLRHISRSVRPQAEPVINERELDLIKKCDARGDRAGHACDPSGYLKSTYHPMRFFLPAGVTHSRLSSAYQFPVLRYPTWWFSSVMSYRQPRNLSLYLDFRQCCREAGVKRQSLVAGTDTE